MQKRELFSQLKWHLLRRGSLFVAAGILAFSLARPQDAGAMIRTIGARACPTDTRVGPDNWIYKSASCSIPVGSDLPTEKLYGAWFEFWTYKSMVVLLRLEKLTYNGTQNVDYINYTTPNGQTASDVWVEAVNAKSNPSNWDFLGGYIWGANEPHGVIVTAAD